ncbi:MAG: AAA-like domain-containing protein [Blastocatellia bacterium]|nr:AAA-like domain-containing protein [Blastocatellia bacterium]
MGSYQFGPFHLDAGKRLLWRDGEVVSLTPKAFDLLCVLVEKPGRVIGKEDLIRRVWQGAIVEEGNLSVNISMLRKALGETHQEHQFIVTHSGRGYSFVADVRAGGEAEEERLAGGDEWQREQPTGGALQLESPFYIERETDAEFSEALRRRDSIILIKGSRQVGKTSLLARGFQQARTRRARVVLTDFQDLNGEYLESVEKLLLMLAELIAEELELSVAPHQFWNPRIGPSSNFERYWKRIILQEISSPIIWGLDEVDRLFNYAYASEVFGLFRSWHNKRALDPGGQWSRLTLTMAYATEAHLFITDLNQSPFNVGTRLSLEDFTPAQVAELNHRYESPLRSPRELSEFFQLVGGHPFLVHHGLREIRRRKLALADLVAQAGSEDGVFGDHLERLRISLNRDPELLPAIRELLADRPCPTAESFYRLRSAGVIRGHSPRDATLRCQLYRLFLRQNSF